jgi:hypothetical protein
MAGLFGFGWFWGVDYRSSYQFCAAAGTPAGRDISAQAAGSGED